MLEAAMTRSTRLAIVIDHPAQQFTRAFQSLSDQDGIEAQVYYWSVKRSVHDPDFGLPVAWDVDLLARYAWVAPRDALIIARVRWLFRQLRSASPDVVVCCGWATPIARLTIIYSVLTRTRLLLYSDSTWQHASSGRHSMLRSFALRGLMRVCAGAVSTGTFNREFYIWHGMNPKRIWPGVCPADTEMFAAPRVNEPKALSVVPRPLRIGFAGKFIARKGADELIRAASLLPAERDWSVTLVGDGPLRPELQDLCDQVGVGDRVIFQGFANTSEMPKLLADFDVVVVPSRLDLRVLVTIEAMAAGAAVVVSDATAVWGPGDLVEHGSTGLVYASGDPSDLARQLARLLQDRILLDRLRRKGMERVADFGPAAFARTMAAAVAACFAAPGRSGTGLKQRASATTGRDG
jgi:glycosyltransferase involved in cell wall biosynthesis